MVDIARVRADKLNQPIFLSELSSIAHIDALKVDGVLQNAREGISIRFAHDIFFEWAFFYVLTECGAGWMDKIRACGEPPAAGRVVELLSQWEYVKGNEWEPCLRKLESMVLRTQWLRAWLMGPLGAPEFDTYEDMFATTVFSDDFRLFGKVLVWFQAEKTVPSATILSGQAAQDQLLQIAYLLAWPSDFPTWRRLIGFIVRRISTTPQRLYPEVLAVFEVWQNALAGYQNPTSHAVLTQCAAWLSALDKQADPGNIDGNLKYRSEIPDLDSFRNSLIRLILRSSTCEPSFAGDYLRRITASRKMQYGIFFEIIKYSPILTQAFPQLLVDLSLAFLRQKLPKDQLAQYEQELIDASEWRSSVLAKPENERTKNEEIMLSHSDFRLSPDFGFHDWEDLSINRSRQKFWPPSPLREPFHSLFQTTPNEALRLLRELCNHAITAWRQLHCYSHDRRATPIPLELEFPWGMQLFWGNSREYLWCRAQWGPHVVECGFMALEEWCFAELERGKPADELIQTIVEGNKCIGILGIAAMIALHTNTVSKTTLPLISSQRLLAADKERWSYDLVSSSSKLIGFTNPTDKIHIEAIQAANSRQVHKKELRWLIPHFIFSSQPVCAQAKDVTCP